MTIHYSQIGEVQFLQNAAAKNIRITVSPFKGVRVTVPKRTSLNLAREFVETKFEWIIKMKSRVEIAEKQRTIFTPDTDYSTKNRKLKLIAWKSEQFRAQMSKDTLKIFYPNEIEIQSNNAQEKIREYIICSLREEAKEYLPQRTEQLAAQHGLTYRGVTVKNIISRWGSCSAKNHINLNIHLIRLPQHLSDYVILHELAHTVHKNHKELFWLKLDVLTGGKSKQLDKELKQYNAVRF